MSIFVEIVILYSHEKCVCGSKLEFGCFRRAAERKRPIAQLSFLSSALHP